VAEAEGDAQATLVKAKAQAEANKLLQEALTPLLIQNKAIERWNGTLPQFTGGGAVPLLNLKDLRVGGDTHAAAAPALTVLLPLPRSAARAASAGRSDGRAPRGGLVAPGRRAARGPSRRG
jgi:hypothetical protein